MTRKTDYLFQRPGSSNWWIKLQSPGKRVEKSLRTSDRKEAEIIALPMIAHHKAALLAAKPRLEAVCTGTAPPAVQESPTPSATAAEPHTPAPLLCIYADLMGMLGGAAVGVGMLHLSATEYLNATINGVSLTDFAVGIGKSAVFGILVALSGCMRGIQCGRSASAVGLAATSAVVTAIVFIIVTDGVFAVLTNALGI